MLSALRRPRADEGETGRRAPISMPEFSRGGHSEATRPLSAGVPVGLTETSHLWELEVSRVLEFRDVHDYSLRQGCFQPNHKFASTWMITTCLTLTTYVA